MAGPTDLAVLMARPDPLPSWLWRSDVVPYGLRPDYVEGTDLPFNNVSVGDKIARGSGYQYYPSTHDISAVTVTLYEDSLATTLKWLNEWKTEVKDFATGLYGYPSVYKKSWTFILNDSKLSPVVSVTLKGVWPADTQPLNLGYSESGRIILSQQFSVDDQSIVFHK